MDLKSRADGGCSNFSSRVDFPRLFFISSCLGCLRNGNFLLCLD